MGILRNILGNILTQYHLIQPDDRIDGCPDLMAHTGKEPVLCFVQGFNLAALFHRLRHRPSKNHDLKPKHKAEHRSHHKDREQGIHVRRAHVMRGNQLGIAEGHTIANDGNNAAHGDQDMFSPSDHSQVNEHGTENKPDRRTAQYSPTDKKCYG